MKQFTITKNNFLDWYFQGDEGEELVKELFNNTNFDSLDVTLTEENEDEFDDTVLGELGVEFKVKLKN